MKILILGGTGRIGSASALDLARDDKIDSVGLVGRRESDLEKVDEWIGSEKINRHVLDLADKKATSRLMEEYDVGIIALPDRRSSYNALESAIESGLNVVDILEEYHRRPDPYEIEGLNVPEGLSLEEYGESLHERAEENGVTILDGMGFAPGLGNITLGEGIRKLDTAYKATARVGGIPTKESAMRHPLGYIITWSFAHVLREYMIKVKAIREGEIVEVDPLSDRERFRFDAFGKDEALEYALTPGMPSFLYTRPNLREFSEKTIRWPGHWDGIDLFNDCGLLSLEPVKFDELSVTPRDFFVSVLEPKLRPLPEDRDVCVMWNSVLGERSGEDARIDYYMWAESDEDMGISAMARVTGFSAAIGARLLGRGEIDGQGIVAPEDGIKGETYRKFMAELGKRGIEVFEAENR